MKGSIVLAALLVVPPALQYAIFESHAQEADAVLAAPDGYTAERIQGIFVVQVQNSPFSAQQEVVWTHPLGDGTIVSRKYYTIDARDTLGRVYRENRNSVPADSHREPPLNYSFILDPETRTRTECRPSTQVCRVISYRPVTALPRSSAGSFNTSAGVLTRELLGNDTIESLDAIGSRETLTMRSQVVGNNQDFVITKEIWYSPQLQINLLVVRNDPRIGKQTFRMTHIDLAEPDAKFFQIPEGYRIVDERKAAE